MKLELTNTKNIQDMDIVFQIQNIYKKTGKIIKKKLNQSKQQRTKR